MIDRTWILNRAVVSLVQQKIISPFDEAKVREMLNQVFDAACVFESKRIMSRHKTPVRLANKEGRSIAEYTSIEEAARDTGYGYTGIQSALKRGSKTKTGLYWEYL